MKLSSCSQVLQQCQSRLSTKVAASDIGACHVTGGSTGTGSPMSPGSTGVGHKKDDGKKKLQQFMHNARKVRVQPE